MKLNTTFDAVLIGIVEDSFEGKDGKDVKFYKISLEQNDGVCMVPCDVKLAESIVKGDYPKYSNYVFYAQFDSEKSKNPYRVVDIC